MRKWRGLTSWVWLLQIIDEGQPELRTAAAVAPTPRGRCSGLLHTVHCLLQNGLVLPVANLAVALARYGFHPLGLVKSES